MLFYLILGKYKVVLSTNYWQRGHDTCETMFLQQIMDVPTFKSNDDFSESCLFVFLLFCLGK